MTGAPPPFHSGHTADPDSSSTHRWIAALTALVLLAFASPGVAQVHPDARNTDVEVNPYRLNLAGTGVLSTNGAAILPHLQTRVSAVAQYLSEPAVVEGETFSTQTRQLVADRQQINLGVAVGLLDRLEVGVRLPFIPYQSASLPGFGLGEAGSAGIGDAELLTRVQLLDPASAPLGLTFGASGTAPTSVGDGYFGHRGFTGRTELHISRTVGPLRFAIAPGALFRQDSSLAALDNGHEMTLRGGFMVAPTETWGAGLEAVASTPLTAPLDDPNATPVELMAGGHYRPTRRFDVYAAVGRGVTGGFGAPSLRAILGVTLHFGRAPEQNASPCEYARTVDSEGVDPEQCPNLDFDDDGIANAADACPRDREDMDGFQDDDGCPDNNNDGDNLADSEDQCPNVPEDLDDFQDDDGCPDPDNDGDGFADSEDERPDDAEDFDGYQDADGCPDVDNDGDGFRDVEDPCPMKPGSRDGCSSGPEPEATVTDERIEISEKIFFVSDRAIVRERSYDVLQKVADVLRENPDIEMVEIRGYADQRGRTDYNYQLSWERAKVVRLWLIHNADVSPNRLRAAGYGETGDGDDTDDAYAQARRVEFKIIQRD